MRSTSCFMFSLASALPLAAVAVQASNSVPGRKHVSLKRETDHLYFGQPTTRGPYRAGRQFCTNCTGKGARPGLSERSNHGPVTTVQKARVGGTRRPKTGIASIPASYRLCLVSNSRLDSLEPGAVAGNMALGFSRGYPDKSLPQDTSCIPSHPMPARAHPLHLNQHTSTQPNTSTHKCP